MKSQLNIFIKPAIFIALGLLLGVSILAAAQEGVIDTCVANSNGSVRIAGSPDDCHSNESYLSWNLPGPPGAQGDAGQNGVDGQDGIDGASCWDALGDTNSDGAINPLDCTGPSGPQGPPGDNGQDGQDGALSLADQSCPPNYALSGFDSTGNMICTPSTEVCDGVDNDGNGELDDGLRYCFLGQPAPNTNGASCNADYYDWDLNSGNGCEDYDPPIIDSGDGE